MQSVPVHIAVLAVAKDGAPTQTVTELASAAGHTVVARATVMDAQASIRAQLTRWIDDPNIDVVIVSGGTESAAASAAMKPLVTEQLPGFTDLFRYLAFQEIGASAMTSNAEAARCRNTVVFVLPAAAGAVRAAMDKLILPQLDSSSANNLVSSMPRIRELERSGVPVAVTQEKTAGGPGLIPKTPALATPPRGRPLTGNANANANIIARRQQADDDPPTKPIDVAKLEQQIALSEAGSAATKQVDLSRLPRLPPGADETLDDGEILQGASRNGRLARLQSEPIPPPAPAPSRVPGDSPRQIQHTPSRGSGVAIVKPQSAPARKPPTDPPPIPPRNNKTEPSAVVPPAKPAVRPGAKPSDPPPRPPPRPSDPPPRPSARPSDPPPPPRPSARPSDPPRTAKRPTDPPAIPKLPTGPHAAPKRPTDPPAVTAEPAPVASETSASTPSESAPRPHTPSMRAPTQSVPIRTPTGSVPVMDVPDDDDVPDFAKVRLGTEPPPPPPKRTPTAPPPAVADAGATSRPDPAAAVRLPAPRPSERNFESLAATSLSRSTGELPLGEFNYPVKKSGSKFLWLIALLAAGALGFFAVVKLFPQASPSGASPQPTPEPVANVAIDAAVVAVAPDPVPVPVQDPEPLVEPDPAPDSTSGKSSGRPVSGGARTPPTTGKVKPAAGSGAGATGSASKPDEEPEQEPPIAPPIADSDCDEVACVLAKYNRPCCEKYRPAESDLKPRGAGGVPTELDKVAVRSTIEKIKPRVVACGEKTSDKGTVKITVKVKPDGSVSEASVDSSPDSVLGDCVATALRNAQFQKTVNGGSFTYPFVF